MMPVFAFISLLAGRYTKGKGDIILCGRKWICVAIDG